MHGNSGHLRLVQLRPEVRQNNDGQPILRPKLDPESGPSRAQLAILPVGPYRRLGPPRHLPLVIHSAPEIGLNPIQRREHLGAGPEPAGRVHLIHPLPPDGVAQGWFENAPNGALRLTEAGFAENERGEQRPGSAS